MSTLRHGDEIYKLLGWLKDLIVCLEAWEADDRDWNDYLDVFLVDAVSSVAEKIRRKSLSKLVVLPFVTPDQDE